MTGRRHEAALDRLDASATSALDLFFGTAEADPSPQPESVSEPVSEPGPDPELASEVATPAPRLSRRRSRPDTPVNALSVPAEPPATPPVVADPHGPARSLSGLQGSIPRPVYVAVATGISPVADDTLHRAAYAAGGEREKSRLVREAVGDLLAAFDAATPSGREGVRELMRRPPLEGRITRIYRLEPETRERLTLFARDERIPIAAALRAAIERRYGPEAEEPDEPAG